MKARRRLFRSWSALAAAGEAALPAGLALVSVDLFDTLLLRRVDGRQIVAAACRELERRLALAGLPPAEPVGPARFAVFTELAAQNAAAGHDFAAGLRQVLPELLRRLTGDRPFPAELPAALERFELELEARFTYPNAGLLGWLRTLQQNGRQLVFCSDMYLAGDQLWRLLEHHGCADLFAAGHSSADSGLLKKTGRLFPQLCRHHGVAPGQVLHLGDCPEADGERAAAAGLHSWVVSDRGEGRRRRALAADAARLAAQPAWTAALAAAPSPAPAGVAADPVLGPICSAFVHAVAERCRRLQVRKVFFLAREGLVLRQLFDLMRPLVWPDGDGPTAAYLAISRLPTFLASARFYGLRQLVATLGNHREPTLRRLLAPLEMDESLMERLARRHQLPGPGFPDLDAPLPGNPHELPPFQRLLEDPELIDHLRERQTHHQALLRDYLEQEGFFGGGRVALVDVGWSGQIEDNLAQAFASDGDLPEMFGLYLGIKKAAHAKERPGCHFEGLVADENEPDWHGGAAFLFVQALEALLRAPHGTVIGYRRDNDRIAPLLRPDDDPARRAEAAEEGVLVKVQAGILEYGRRYAELAGLTGSGAADALPWARSCLDRLLRYPLPAEARFLFSFSNVCDLGMAEVLPLGGEGAPGRLANLRSRLRLSLWKEGTWTLIAGRLGRHLGIVWHAFRAAPPAAERKSCPAKAEAELELGAPRPASAVPGSGPSPLEISTEQYCRELLAAATAAPPPLAPPGLGYFLAQACSRRLTNLLCRLRGKSPYRANGFPALLWLQRVWSACRQRLLGILPR